VSELKLADARPQALLDAKIPHLMKRFVDLHKAILEDRDSQSAK
jgi:hypothetical protein